MLERPIGPAHAIGLDADKHRPALVRSQALGLTLLLAEHESRDTDDTSRREPLTYALLDLGHDLTADLSVEVARAPHRLTPGDPDRVGQRADRTEELDCGRASSHDQHLLVAEMLGSGVLHCMQLLADEGLGARVVGDERVTPRAGGVDDRASEPLPVAGIDAQQTILIAHGGHPDRTDHG